jgi:hypothetical protein
MTQRRAFLALALAAAASPAAAVVSIPYQNALLGLSLSKADATFCNQKVGTPNPGNKDEYDQCRVTRLYLLDLSSGADQGRFPPMADIKYANGGKECGQITDAMVKNL